jgi:hypothetical protein
MIGNLAATAGFVALERFAYEDSGFVIPRLTHVPAKWNPVR